MEPISPSIRLMTNEELYQRHLHNRGLMLDHQGHNYVLNAGTSDRVYVFSRSICIFVLTINKPLGYIGLDAYMQSTEPDPLNTIFLHSEYQFQDLLGPKWNQLSPRAIAQRLVDYLI